VLCLVTWCACEIKISSIYIYEVKFLTLLGAPIIYDISRLRVNWAGGGGRMYGYVVHSNGKVYNIFRVI
jgi:hypothetical protein